MIIPTEKIRNPKRKRNNSMDLFAIGAIGAAVIGLLAFLFNHEKGKRAEAEQQIEEMEQALESKTVEAKAETQAAAVSQETAAFMQELDEKIESGMKEIHEALASEQAQIYNANVRKWKKVKR